MPSDRKMKVASPQASLEDSYCKEKKEDRGRTKVAPFLSLSKSTGVSTYPEGMTLASTRSSGMGLVSSPGD